MNKIKISVNRNTSFKSNFINFLIILLFLCNLNFFLPIIIDAIYPDEVVQYLWVDNLSFIGAIIHNWSGTSIGRIGGVFWVDLWMEIIKFLHLNNIYGFYLYRLITFLFMIYALVILFYFLFKDLSIKFCILIGNFFFFIFCIVTSPKILNGIFGVDLSLYGINLFYLVIIIICLLRIYNNIINTRLVYLYFFFLFIYLNSSYTHLILTPFLFLFGLYNNKEIKFIFSSPIKFLNKFKFLIKKNFFSVHNKNYIFLISLLIYLISVIIHLSSRSLEIRKAIWPTSISFLEGINNSTKILSFVIFNVWSYEFFFITISTLFITLKYNFYKKFNYLFLLIIIMLAPINMFFTNALAYMSPSLHVNLMNLFYFQKNGNNIITLTSGLSARHFFYINNVAILSYTFLGILIGLLLKKTYVQKNYS